LYFDGALLDPPAPARSNASVNPARIVSAPAMVTGNLRIASSIRSGQPKQADLEVSCLDGCCPASHSMSPSCKKRNDQSFATTNISD
jgi:hypothetical protein